jgi:hypothetical protein
MLCRVCEGSKNRVSFNPLTFAKCFFCAGRGYVDLTRQPEYFGKPYGHKG